MPILKLLKGRASQREFSVETDHVTLGRDAGHPVCLLHEKVSRKHAEIVRIDQDYYLIDCKSRNGTLLNGKRLEPSVCYQLSNHDLIKISDYILEFVTDSSDPWRSRAPSGYRGIEMVGDPLEKAQTYISSHLDSSSQSWEGRLTSNPQAKLRAIMELTRDCYRALDLDDVLGKVLESLLRIFPQATRAVILLTEEPTGELVPRTVKHRFRDSTTDRVPLSRSVIEHVLRSQQAIISNDLKSDPRFYSSMSVTTLPTYSVMCAPLLDLEGRSLGVVQLDCTSPQARFTTEDLDLLATIAIQACVAVEQCRVHEAVLLDRAIQRDLELAREIQMSLLPTEPPRIAGYDFYDFYAPATQVGGDYYDYMPLSNNRLAVVLGDVAGKGIPAALLMTKLSSEMRVYLASGMDPVDVVQQVNASFAERSPYGSFVTLALLVLHTTTHEVQLVNAGHVRPLLRRADGSLETLGQTCAGFPLGLAADHPYRDESFSLAPGDSVVLFSDGVTDALDSSGERYGLERLSAQVKQTNSSAGMIGRRVMDDLLLHAGAAPQADDICLLCISRSERTAAEDESQSS